jgi:hypothetical protein
VLLEQTPLLRTVTGYSEAALRACLVEMHSLLSGSTTAQLQAVRRKYTLPKHGEVATIPLPSL